MKRGKAWTSDECYLAVWIYDQLDSKSQPGLKTSLYKQIAEIIGRTPASVEFKIQNVSAIDPRQANEKPIGQKDHYQALLKKVFEWYWMDKKASRELYDLVVLRIKNQNQV